MALLDRRTVALGVAVQAAATVPPVLLARAATADDVGGESWLAVPAAAMALLVAPALAGAVAARRQPRTPVLHAAVATAAAWLLLALVTVVRLAVDGRPLVDALTFITTFAPIEVGVGVLAASAARPRRLPAEDADGGDRTAPT